MSPTLKEMEFFAAKEEIEILTQFAGIKFQLITCEFGPFDLGVPARVPLWAALCLRELTDSACQKSLIKDIWDIRMEKLYKAILVFLERGASWAKVDNLTKMEMCAVKPFFTNSLEQFNRFRKTIESARRRTTYNSSTNVPGRLGV